MRVLCKNQIFAFKDRILGQPLETGILIENLPGKVLVLRVVLTVCCVCVACELHGRATQHNHHASKA